MGKVIQGRPAADDPRRPRSTRLLVLCIPYRCGWQEIHSDYGIFFPPAPKTIFVGIFV